MKIPYDPCLKSIAISLSESISTIDHLISSTSSIAILFGLLFFPLVCQSLPYVLFSVAIIFVYFLLCESPPHLFRFYSCSYWHHTLCAPSFPFSSPLDGFGLGQLCFVAAAFRHVTLVTILPPRYDNLMSLYFYLFFVSKTKISAKPDWLT